MEKVRNIFSVDVGRYAKNSTDRRLAFDEAKAIWHEATHRLLVA